MTPLLVAVVNGHFFCVQHLLQAGADPLITDNFGRNALFAASFNTGSAGLTMVECILDSAYDKQALLELVSAPMKDGRTALHAACASSNVDVVHRLLKAGADVNAQSHDGATPVARVRTKQLHYISMSCSWMLCHPVVELLILCLAACVWLTHQ